MVTALIVIGVVLFLAVDAYVVYRVFASRKSAGEYGSFAVPGEASVTIPAGKLKLSYQESYRASRSGDSIDFSAPSGLSVAVTSPTGEQLEVRKPRFYSVSTGSGWSRALLGTVEVTAPGEHIFSASLDGSGHVEPQILIGK